MDNNYNNQYEIYDSTREVPQYNAYATRYDRFDNRYDNRFDNRYDNRRSDYNDYNRFYDRGYDNMRYYRYPYCDRYGRCENPIWWLFWPFFFR